MAERLSAKGLKKAKDANTKLTVDTPKIGRRERNRLEKLARITEAARTLFREKGYQGTTITDIAEAADIGFGTLFLYAKSKEELLVMVFIDEMMEVVNKTSAKMPKKPLLDQVLFLFNGFVAYHKRDEPLSRALLKEIFFLDNPERHRDVMVLMDNIYGKLSHLIEAAQADGTFRQDANAFLVSRNLFAIFMHYLKAWLGGLITYASFNKILAPSLELQLTQLQTTPEKTPVKRDK